MDKIILLHICCAPCAVGVVERLREEQCKVTGFFYNPNIYPKKEYDLRLDNVYKLASQIGGPFFVGPYNTKDWYQEVQGLEVEPEGGKRCEVCYRMRLDYTAQVAKSKGYELFTTTLTVSPNKPSKIINPIGQEVGERYKIKFLEQNFKKQDGFKRSVILSNKYGLYRQSYCGCEFSMH